MGQYKLMLYGIRLFSPLKVHKPGLTVGFGKRLNDFKTIEPMEFVNHKTSYFSLLHSMLLLLSVRKNVHLFILFIQGDEKVSNHDLVF